METSYPLLNSKHLLLHHCTLTAPAQHPFHTEAAGRARTSPKSIIAGRGGGGTGHTRDARPGMWAGENVAGSSISWEKPVNWCVIKSSTVTNGVSSKIMGWAQFPGNQQGYFVGSTTVKLHRSLDFNCLFFLICGFLMIVSVAHNHWKII